MTGVELIAAERKRQIEEEGFTAGHDVIFRNNELAWCACCYAAPANIYKCLGGPPGVYRFIDPWPDWWDPIWDKRAKHQRIRRLEIAGALIAAEIDRLQDLLFTDPA